MKPSLDEALASLAAAGVRRVRIVPVKKELAKWLPTENKPERITEKE